MIVVLERFASFESVAASEAVSTSPQVHKPARMTNDCQAGIERQIPAVRGVLCSLERFGRVDRHLWLGALSLLLIHLDKHALACI